MLNNPLPTCTINFLITDFQGYTPLYGSAILKKMAGDLTDEGWVSSADLGQNMIFYPILPSTCLPTPNIKRQSLSRTPEVCSTSQYGAI
jgi:hypothetical protein